MYESDETEDQSAESGDESGDESESNDEEDIPDEGGELRSQLGDIPFGEIQKLKQSVGLKKYNEAIFGVLANSKTDESEGDGLQKHVHGKKSVDQAKDKMEKKVKSAPEEVSSKRRTFKPRNVVNEVKRKHRDPRFDNLSGKFNEDLFQKSYSFVDDMKKDELKVVKKQFKKAKGKERKSSLHKLLQRMEEQEKAKSVKLKRTENERKRKKEQFVARTSGKKAFYMKKSEAKKLEIVEKYKSLKESGQLEKVMSKKRKHVAAKEKKKFLDMK